MLLTIRSEHNPATDLGFLLHKHPDKLQSTKLSVGQAHIFYPEATPARTTVALLLDIDPIALVRGAKHSSTKDFSLFPYVNDRPYVASSFMSVAIAKAFSSALNGKCPQKPDLVDTPMPLSVKLSVLPAAKGGETLIRKLFEPLGYQVTLQRHILDEQFPKWGESKYFTIQLSNVLKVKELLTHLYVLIPVLDNDKHYFISESEIDKLLSKGKGWLEHHPEKEQISNRYLANIKSLAQQAMQRLQIGEEPNDKDEIVINPEARQRKLTLQQQRLSSVLAELKQSQAKTVLDLGCGDGKLLKMLMQTKQFVRIAGMDVSYQELLRTKERLYWEELAGKQKDRLSLFQGSLTYKDTRLQGFDAAAVVEVIEHMEGERLPAFAKALFGFARPKTVILTTPNVEYNSLYENLVTGNMRHNDHRFEWTRQQFQDWAKQIAQTYGYRVEFKTIGDVDPSLGSPSQMGVFTYGN